MKNFTFINKNQRKLFLVLISLLMGVLNLNAITITSKATGDWNNTATWNPAQVPTINDDVIVANTHTVTINANGQACKTMTVNTGGTLRFNDKTASNIFTVNGDFTINGTFTQNNNQGWPVDVYGSLIINGIYSTTDQAVTNVKITMKGDGGTVIGGTNISNTTNSQRFCILEINLNNNDDVVTLQGNMYFDGTNSGNNAQLLLTKGIFNANGKQIHWKKFGKITTTANGKFAWLDSGCDYTTDGLPSIYYDGPTSGSDLTVTGTIYIKDFVYTGSNFKFPNNAGATVAVFGNLARNNSDANMGTGTFQWGPNSHYYGTQYSAANRPVPSTAIATGPARIASVVNAAYVTPTAIQTAIDACTLSPAVALADNGTQVGAASVVAGTNKNSLFKLKLDVTVLEATLSAVGFTTTGTATASDITNFKLWYNTSDNLGTATQIGSSITSGTGAGSRSFTGLSQAIAKDATGYLWITADIASAAVYARTVAVSAITTANLTFVKADLSGSTTAGGTQTIATAPSVTTGSASAIGNTTATLNGTVSGNGLSSTVTFNYGTSISYGSNSTANESPVSTQSTAVTGSLTGLTANTLYNYRVSANNTGGTVNGNNATFTTLPNAPTVGSGSDPLPSGFVAHWTAPTGQGSEAFTYTIEVDDDDEFGSVNASQDNISSATLSKLFNTLAPGTTYYYRVKAVNATGSSAWSAVSAGIATTAPTAPILTTPTASAVTNSSATLGATVLSNGGDTMTERGTAYSTTSPVAANDNALAEGGTSIGAYTHSRSGLAAQTLYYYVGYAINGIGTDISDEGSFRTLSNPATAQPGTFTATAGIAQIQLDWTSATFPESGASATGYILLRRQDGSNPSATGIVNATAPASLSLPGGTTLVTTITSGATLTYTNTALSNGQAYNYLIVPFTWDGVNATTYNYYTTSAPTASATTPNSPTATTAAATSVSTTGVTLNGTVSANGMSTVVTFNYGTSESYGTDVTASESPVTTQSAAVSAAVSGLTANTLYNYRVSGTNGVGTTNGNNVTVTTLSNAPTVGGASSPTSSGFTANWTAPTGQGSASITYTVEASTSNTFGNIAQTVTGVSGTTTPVTGLAASTTYYFRVKAVNAGGSSAWSGASAAVITADIDTDGTAPAVGNNINSVADQYTIYSVQRSKYLYDATGTSGAYLTYDNGTPTVGPDTRYAWYEIDNGSGLKAYKNVQYGNYIVTESTNYVGYVNTGCAIENVNRVDLVNEATFNTVVNDRKYWTKTLVSGQTYTLRTKFIFDSWGYYLNTAYSPSSSYQVLISAGNCNNNRNFTFGKYTATPDLTITDVTTTIVGGNVTLGSSFDATATIKNNGLFAIASGTSIKVKFVLGGQVYTTTYTGGLGAGASTTLPAVTITPNQELTSVSLVATVNSNWAVAEYNYSNNTHTTSNIKVEGAYYYRTESDGVWTSTSLWEYSSDGNTWQTTSTVPNAIAKNITIANTVTVPEASEVSATKVIINPDSKLTVAGELTVNDTITIVSTDAGTAQVLNNGILTNNGVVIVRKTFTTSGGWYFISLPYNVPAAKIFIGGTATQATWGDLTDSGKDFYVQEYDAASRAAGNFSATSSPNWINVAGKELVANKGYIVAVTGDITLDFVSAIGQSALFASSAEVTVAKHTSVHPTNQDWNLVGTPFASSFDLYHASQTQAPFYIFNGMTYDAVMADDSYNASPFTSFFLQAIDGTSLNFANSGRLLKAASIVDFDEIGLVLKNAKYSDKTRIRLQDGASTGYDLGKDAVKFFTPKAGVPQIASKQGGEYLAVNAVPKNTTKVELSVTIAEDGEYTISMEDVAKAAGCSQVILVDGEVETDLLAGDSYSFAGTAGSTKNVSVLLVAEGTTAVGTAQGNSILIQTIGDKAYITGLEGAATVNVYDVAGKLTQRFTNVNNNDALTLTNAGVAIIQVNTATQAAKAKVSVTK